MVDEPQGDEPFGRTLLKGLAGGVILLLVVKYCDPVELPWQSNQRRMREMLHPEIEAKKRLLETGRKMYAHALGEDPQDREVLLMVMMGREDIVDACLADDPDWYRLWEQLRYKQLSTPNDALDRRRARIRKEQSEQSK